MNKFHCEMFGHFVYDENLSYHDLLEMEGQFIGMVQGLLAGQDAEHIDFTPLGDELMVQCAFDAWSPELFHALCAGLCERISPHMQGRLLFVDKHLTALHVFHVNHEHWRETRMPIPSATEVLGKPRSPAPAENSVEMPHEAGVR